MTVTRLALVAVLAGLVASLVPTAPEGPLPPARDQRPEPELIRVQDPLQALAYADARLVAEVSVAEDPWAPEAVAWVVSNRMQAEGKTALQVVTARRQFGTRKRGRWYSSWPRSSRWLRAHAYLVQMAIWPAYVALGRVGPDPTGGATHFHRLDTWTPPWAPPRGSWARHGRHWFYRLQSDQGAQPGRTSRCKTLEVPFAERLAGLTDGLWRRSFYLGG